MKIGATLARCILVGAECLITNFWGHVAFAQSLTPSCDEDMQKAHAKFVAKFENQNRRYLRLTRKNLEKTEAMIAAGTLRLDGGIESRQKGVALLISRLVAADADTIKHEEAHEKAAGEWAGETAYLYYVWDDVNYATAGCHMPKDLIPLRVLISAALGPDNPSDHDLAVVKQTKKHIKIKKARAKCNKIKNKNKKKKCLKKYTKYAWLDDYPLK